MKKLAKLSVSLLVGSSIGMTGCGERSQPQGDDDMDVDEIDAQAMPDQGTDPTADLGTQPLRAVEKVSISEPSPPQETTTTDATYEHVEVQDESAGAAQSPTEETDASVSISTAQTSLENAVNPPQTASNGSPVPVEDLSTEAVRQMGHELDTYIVQPGDTLSSIADEIYGDPAMYTAIYETNKDVLANIDTLGVGQSLTLPDR